MRYGSALGLGLLLAIALAELALQHRDADAAPTVSDYARLSEPISRLRRPDEPVVIAPNWAQPWLRQALGDAVMPISDLARPDDRAVKSALVVAMLGERPVAFDGWSAEPLGDSGPFELIRYENPSVREVRFDFLRAFGPNNVEVTLAGAPCAYRSNARMSSGGLGGHPTFAAQRFQCAGGEFFQVGRTTIADERFLPRRCLWAHPPARGELILRFRNVALGTRLLGHGGMYWIMERERTGAPVELVALVDGSEVGRTFHADGDGWAEFDFPLGRHAGRTGATVEWRVSSPDNRHRHFCFEARSL